MRNSVISFGLFGAGRVGSVHAANIASHPQAELRYVYDVNEEAAGRLAVSHGAQSAAKETALSDPAVTAVLIASPSETHADLIERSALAGKAILCEKPVGLDIGLVDRCLEIVNRQGVTFGVGFNRRFDTNFQRLHEAIQTQKIGALEMLTITSRDPSPPPLEYIKDSGGLFRDMMIHDFDVARWLLGEEPCEVYASASCLVDPAIAEQGDVDTAVVVLKTPSGKLCQISNSRRAVYGYDQRVEIFGSKGMMRAENECTSQVEHFGAEGIVSERPLELFIDRYAAAYQRELHDFIQSVAANENPAVQGEDGRRALLLANAAHMSLQTQSPVDLGFENRKNS